MCSNASLYSYVTLLQFLYMCVPSASVLAGALYVGGKLEALTALVKRVDELEEQELHTRISVLERAPQYTTSPGRYSR